MGTDINLLFKAFFLVNALSANKTTGDCIRYFLRVKIFMIKSNLSKDTGGPYFCRGLDQEGSLGYVAYDHKKIPITLMLISFFLSMIVYFIF